MSKIIIGIHGLGNKPPKELLEKWWKQSIREGLRGIGKYIFNPKLELIYWADVLHDKPQDINITDKKDPNYLDERYTQAPKNYIPKDHTVRKKFLDLLEKQMDRLFLNKDLSINFSFISDFIIHKYFKDLEIYYTTDCLDKDDKNCTAKEIIRKKAAEVLKKYKNYKILLVSHSMGSIIAFDVLTFSLPDIKIDTFVTMGSPLGIPIVKSKIAAEQNLKMNKTNKLKTPPGVERYWYNYSDLEDKVAINYNLGNDYDENSKGIKAVDFVVNNNYEIDGERNPHKLYGYLRTPEFSNVLIDFLVYDKNKITKWLLDVSNNVYTRLNKSTLKILRRLISLISGEDDES